MCVALPPTNSKTASPGKIWLWLTASPWRFLFAAGLLSLVLGRLAALSGYSLPHYFSFSVLPFFVAGAVLAVVPRWLGQDTTYDYSFLKNVAALAPAAALALLYAVSGWILLAAVSALLVSISYLSLLRRLRQMIFWSHGKQKTLAWLVTAFVGAGLVASVMWLAGLIHGSSAWTGSSAQIMTWASAAPVFLILALTGIVDRG